MISADGRFMHCDEKDCEAKIPNHKWGRIREGVGWFFTLDGKQMRCPDHDPRKTDRAQKAASTAILLASIDERLELLTERLDDLEEQLNGRKSARRKNVGDVEL